jgi:hypothetical protein
MYRLQTTLLVATLAATGFAQDGLIGSKSPSPQGSPLEMNAIVNLRKFVAGESDYAMNHTREGFACDAGVLTQMEWQNSPTHAKLIDPEWLVGTRDYKYSAACDPSSKPGSKLNVLATPVDPRANLRAFCATATFGPYESAPYFATGGSSIRSITAANAESCFSSGKPLK